MPDFEEVMEQKTTTELLDIITNYAIYEHC